MFALVFDATNLIEKSCVSSAYQSAIEATSTKKGLAYIALSPLRSEVDRRHVRARIRCDELDREVVREQRVPERDRGDEHEEGACVHRPLSARDEVGPPELSPGARARSAPGA